MLTLKNDERATASLILRRAQARSLEELLVAWLIALPEGVDPARAARIALDGMATSKIGARVPTRLRELLLEVTRYRAIYRAPVGRRRCNRVRASAN